MKSTPFLTAVALLASAGAAAAATGAAAQMNGGKGAGGDGVMDIDPNGAASSYVQKQRRTHKKFVHDYVVYYGGARPAGWKPPLVGAKTDRDVLRENHRFLRSVEDDAVTSWEKRLAKKYYDKLFKEYAIVDLSRYTEV